MIGGCRIEVIVSGKRIDASRGIVVVAVLSSDQEQRDFNIEGFLKHGVNE